jgi:hypothetical protein
VLYIRNTTSKLERAILTTLYLADAKNTDSNTARIPHKGGTLDSST